VCAAPWPTRTKLAVRSPFPVEVAEVDTSKAFGERAYCHDPASHLRKKQIRQGERSNAIRAELEFKSVSGAAKGTPSTFETTTKGHFAIVNFPQQESNTNLRIAIGLSWIREDTISRAFVGRS